MTQDEQLKADMAVLEFQAAYWLENDEEIGEPFQRIHDYLSARLADAEQPALEDLSDEALARDLADAEADWGRWQNGEIRARGIERRMEVLNAETVRRGWVDGERPALPADAEQPAVAGDAGLRDALEKIDAIRNSIIGFQNVGWSDHIYPLVAALEEAGFKGLGYEEARANVQAMLDERLELEARAALSTSVPAGVVKERPAQDLTDAELAQELEQAAAAFARRGEHGGSPGEWAYERMCEIETEQRRRAQEPTR